MGLKIEFPFIFTDDMRCTIGVELWGLEEEEYDAGTPLSFEPPHIEVQAFPELSDTEDPDSYQAQQEALERRLEDPKIMQHIVALVLRALVVECHLHREDRARRHAGGDTT